MKYFVNIGKYCCYVMHDRELIFQFMQASYRMPSYIERWYCSNIQESGERTVVSKPSAADEAIETLANAYRSSSTSENAKKEMHDINEMVSIWNHVFWYLHMTMLLARDHIYDIVSPANPGRSDDKKEPGKFPDQGACTHQEILCEHV